MTKVALQNLDFIEDHLKQMVADVEAFTGEEQTVTSLYRIGDPGVHGQLPLRGIDLRCHDKEIGAKVEEYMNSLWSYDPSRPEMKACIFHDVGRGIHLHLQCHPRTERNR